MYTIGYDLNGAGTGSTSRAAGRTRAGTRPALPPSRTGTGVHRHAGERRPIRTEWRRPLNFYNQPNQASLNDVFRAIAIDLSGSRGRLIDNTSPNLIG